MRQYGARSYFVSKRENEERKEMTALYIFMPLIANKRFCVNSVCTSTFVVESWTKKISKQ